MSTFKCKMCGGNIEFEQGATVGVCDSCGTRQTLPRLDDDRRANLYDRANHFRRNNEFDKAAGIYEQILNEDPSDAEAYWSLVLCQYGIEYVEDPATHKRLPTVNRAQFTSIFDDDNYRSALQYADVYQRAIYEQEAKAINEIQKGILAISQKEEPFDVFICYKETDNNGRRTPDSVLANDLYHQLIQEGFKVFFARITLEDKLGAAYEPYIFAALNSAKVMVVLGTRPEYFNAVWVKNEWSRYLALVKKSGGKKILIPAYRDMDPYDLPEEFSHLQAQDMSKLGFMQDLIRGIKKLVDADPPAPTVKETVVVGANSGADPLLKRAFMALEDGEFDRADEFCEQALNVDPENARAYLGKMMAELNVRREADLEQLPYYYSKNPNYKKALRFGDAEFISGLKAAEQRQKDRLYSSLYDESAALMRSAKTEDEFRKAAEAFGRTPGFKDSDELAAQCLDKAETARLMIVYNGAVIAMNSASDEAAFRSAAERFKTISGFKDSDDLAAQCLDKAEVCRKDAIYASAHNEQIKGTIDGCESAIRLYESISGWKDADEQIIACQRKIEEIKAKEEADRLERERQAEELRIAKKKKLKFAKNILIILIIFISSFVVFLAVGFLISDVLIPNGEYNSAISMIEKGKYVEAYEALINLNGYKDSAAKANKIYAKYQLITAKVGDYVVFGYYEQDDEAKNGKEEVEWLVLAKEGDKALVISRYALDCQKYNTSNTNVTWETCSLRKWLNGTFISSAFNSDEQEMILSTAVTADENPEFSISPGNDTTDKVFLLSILEVNKYFISDSARQCSATAYGKAQRAYTNTSNGNCWWWLRSPGNSSIIAAVVYDDGSVGGCSVDRGGDYRSGVAVRPAMWISLD